MRADGEAVDDRTRDLAPEVFGLGKKLHPLLPPWVQEHHIGVRQKVDLVAQLLGTSLGGLVKLY